MTSGLLCRQHGAALACALLFALPSLQAADTTRIARSSGAKAPEFQELHDYDAAARPLSDATFPYEVQVRRAHVVMLAEHGIVTRPEATTDPALRAYLSGEAALIRAIGPAAAAHTFAAE